MSAPGAQHVRTSGAVLASPPPAPHAAAVALSDVNLNRLVVFVAVVEAGSLAAAARKLGLAKAMVTAHIQRLEREVGASLLVRTTRQLRLTEAGAAFFEASRAIVQQAERAIGEVGRDREAPHGTLRVALPVDYAPVVAPVAAALTQRYPELRIDLVTSDRIVDLIGGDDADPQRRNYADIALRLGWLKDSTLQTVKVGAFAQWLVATPAFLDARGAPKTPAALAAQPFVAFSALAQPATWTLTGPRRARAEIRFRVTMSCDATLAVRAAVLAGAGYGVLTDIAIADDVTAGRLVRVLPAWSLPDGGIHAVFPPLSPEPRKRRVFLDALRAHLAAR